MTARGGPREFIGIYHTIAVLLVLVEVYFIVNIYILVVYSSIILILFLVFSYYRHMLVYPLGL